MKSLAFIHRNDTRFSVGSFSPVLSIFSYHELGNTVSPFLLLDHIGPGRLLPSTKQRGVEDHPHRGFETVTLVYAGELEHRDSTGGGGIVGAGDVQWMTAAHGVVHREMFSEPFTRLGGAFEMIQLWVNLPAAHKLDTPRYQGLGVRDIPVIELPGSTGQVRIIAGQFGGTSGPAKTFTPINVLDGNIASGCAVTFEAAPGDTALVYLRSGRLQFDSGEVLEEQGLAVMSSLEADFRVSALERSKFLILTGTPLNEPINGHGPFVMNNYDEILQAYDDIKNDRFTQPASR